MTNKLTEINAQQRSTTDKFTEIYHYLKANGHSDLAASMLSTGVSSYEDAVAWFYDYYILDENEGYAKATEIKNEIDHANPNKLYYGNPDFTHGYDYTPSDLVPVDDLDLKAIINETIDKYELIHA